MTYHGRQAANLTAIGMRLVVAGALVVVTLTFLGGARAWSVAADGHRRAQEESVARQSRLHRQLADKDAVLESQRRIYMERFRKLEAQVRAREQDVVVLRARLADRGPLAARARVD